jgi:hypothetical protein
MELAGGPRGTMPRQAQALADHLGPAARRADYAVTGDGTPAAPDHIPPASERDTGAAARLAAGPLPMGHVVRAVRAQGTAAQQGTAPRSRCAEQCGEPRLVLRAAGWSQHSRTSASGTGNSARKPLACET